MMHYPSAQRNSAPILEVMKRNVPTETAGAALEVASGTGQHVSMLAQHYPQLQWQPTDIEQRLLDSCDRYTEGLANVLPARLLDASQDWAPQLPHIRPGSVRLVFNVNMVHISPWRCSPGLVAGCGRMLTPGGELVMYGPFAEDGVLTPQSNVDFDRSLRAQNSEWGIRDIAELRKAAEPHGLTLHQKVDMPSNNKMLFWRKG